MVAQTVKCLPATQETRVRSLGQEDLTPVLLPRKFHGWRSLVGYSPWSRKESETTEWLHFHFIKDDTGWDGRRIKNRSSFCLKSVSHEGSRCWEKDTPACLYSPLIYTQKKPLNVIWEEEDVLKAFPLTGGQQPAKVTPCEKGNGLQTKVSVTPCWRAVSQQSFSPGWWCRTAAKHICTHSTSDAHVAG